MTNHWLLIVGVAMLTTAWVTHRWDQVSTARQARIRTHLEQLLKVPDTPDPEPRPPADTGWLRSEGVPYDGCPDSLAPATLAAHLRQVLTRQARRGGG